MNSAGIDYGVRRIAYALPSKNIFEELLLKSKDDIANLVVMSDWTREIVQRTRPELTVIEQPIQGASRNIRTGISLGMVAGALAVATQQAKSPVVMINPSTWKKEVIGNGRADKQAITEWLKRQHPQYQQQCELLKSQQDGTDATCMAIYGNKRLA
jgi:hypothetical protein